MLTAESVNSLHHELKMIIGDSLVLLGGSYFSGGAVEKSDIDFFVVANLFSCYRIWKKRKLIRKWKEQNAGVKINVMIVPRFFYNRGWYYISGRGLDGKQYFSKFRRDLVLRNAYKLSAFYGLKFLFTGDENWQRKAGKQLAIIDQLYNQLTNRLTVIEPIEWSREKLLAIGDRQIINQFCWVNYFIYNLKFLPKLNFNFLFCNPDKKVWRQLLITLRAGTITKERLNWLEKYVFPVIII